MTIADHFTLPKILRFALPSMVMMVFTSLYTIVDGLAVSNLVGDQAFSSLNLIWPAVGMLGAFGFMIGERRQRAHLQDAWRGQAAAGV